MLSGIDGERFILAQLIAYGPLASINQTSIASILAVVCVLLGSAVTQ